MRAALLPPGVPGCLRGLSPEQGGRGGAPHEAGRPLGSRPRWLVSEKLPGARLHSPTCVSSAAALGCKHAYETSRPSHRGQNIDLLAWLVRWLLAKVWGSSAPRAPGFAPKVRSRVGSLGLALAFTIAGADGRARLRAPRPRAAHFLRPRRWPGEEEHPPTGPKK